MIIVMKHLNGNTKVCEECGGSEYVLEGFTSESAGKKYRHLSLVGECLTCKKKLRVRTGKIKEVTVV